MTTNNKISPAFEPFLSEIGTREKQDAIVIYQIPDDDHNIILETPLTPDMRQGHIEDMATAQKRVEARLFERYVEAGQKHLPANDTLEVSSIGANTLPVATVEVTRRTLPALAEQPEVVAVLPNQKIHLIEPNEINYSDLLKQEARDGLTWGLKQMKIPKMWEYTRGENINVAVLDTGVYGEHPILDGRVKDFVVIDPLGRRIEAGPSFDGGRHGTHVCGTIAGGETPEGVSIGVAPEANLLVAGVLIGDATLRTLIEGLSWAVEKGAHIVNMSLGFSYYEPLFNELFNILIKKFGILPVVAIGNENHGNTSSPGNVPSAFSVGAAEKMPRGKTGVAFFSSGASLSFPGDEENNLISKPDVTAPGVQVFSCIPPERTPTGLYEYTYMDGTSMATPHMAGVAALLMAAHPTAPVTEIAEVLKETAKHPDGNDLRPDNRWGYGMVHPLDALEALT